MSVAQVPGVYRLSFLQEGLLFHTVDDPDAACYVDQVVYELDGDLDVGLLDRAWQALTRRHAVLRTSFHWKGISELVQVVHEEAAVRTRVLDWRDEPAAERDAALAGFLRADRLSGFALDRAPLIRLTAIRYGEREYRFVFRYHHLLLDAWSGLMVLEEAFANYDRLAAGGGPEAAPARSFHDYVAWVREQDLGAAERFWRDALRGVTEPTPVPVIRPSTVDGERDAGEDSTEEIAVVPPDVADALRAAAREHRLTLGALLHTCWALLLSRYAGRDDVVFGSTMSSRPADLPGAAETVGLFISTLPVRVRLRPADSVVETCRRVQREQAELARYDFSPLAQVQGWSEVPAGEPLFDTIMTVLNVPGIGALERRDGAVSLRDGKYRYRTNYPLSLLVIPAGDGGLALRAGYDPARVRRDDVTRLLGHLRTVVAAVAADPVRRVADVPLLTDAETALVLGEWAGRPAEPGERLAHQVLAEAAAKDPDAVAVRHGEEELSHGELDRRANQLAHHLRAAGVGPDAVVGLCLPRCVDRIVAVLAVWKAGGCFVPLDAEHPPARLAGMVAEADIRVLVTDRERRARLPRTGGHTVLVDAHRARIDAQPAEPPEPVGGPDDLAYVIYTSGSTGRPKGVMVTHRGLVNLIRAQRGHFGLGSGDRVLQWAAATFDASVFETVLALGAGATLHVADQERVAPGRDLADLLRDERITALVVTPSALAATAAGPLPELRLLVLAGEALPADLVARWSAPGRRVVNAYGPTEATVWVTAADVTPGPDAPPIGRPVDGLLVRVLDAAGRPVPVGLPGELCVGGVALARGYLGQPEQTAERFGPDPYGPPGGRLYRTGDLVRWRPDGQLEFVGRADRQVKVRGFRIETGEVEAALRALPGVADCAVVAHASPGAAQPDTLAAYVVPKGTPVPAAELRDRLGQTLPGYLVPDVLHPVAALPLTGSGKLDEAALPAAARAAAEPAAPAREPRSTAERAVVALWSEVLGAAEIGVDDDFFELGGNSIKATQVVSRVRRLWQVDLPLRSLFQARTVAGFATVLERALAEQPTDEPA